VPTTVSHSGEVMIWIMFLKNLWLFRNLNGSILHLPQVEPGIAQVGRGNHPGKTTGHRSLVKNGQG